MKQYTIYIYISAFTLFSVCGIYSYYFLFSPSNQLIEKNQDIQIQKTQIKQLNENLTKEIKQSKKKFIVPKTDVIRVEPSGNFLIAGSGKPMSKISIIENNEILQSTDVDENGKWVILSNNPLSEGSHLLIIEQKFDNNTSVLSKEIFVTTINRDKKSKPLIASLPNNDGGKLQIIQSPSKDKIVSNMNKNNLFDSEIILSKTKENKIIQSADEKSLNLLTGIRGSVQRTNFKLYSIHFDETGHVSIHGQAVLGNKVRLSIDGNLINSVNINENGKWRFTSLFKLSYGQHFLNAILIDKYNNELDRISLPFLRAKIPEGLLPEDYIIIKPGDMLWKISYRLYGSPWRYVEIYNANKDQISNPDLIFPGQIFTIPDNSD